MGDTSRIVPANIVNFPNIGLFYIHCRRGIGVAAQIQAFDVVLHIQLILLAYIITRKDNAAVAFYLHLCPVARSVVGKGGAKAVRITNPSDRLERSGGENYPAAAG